MYLKLNVYNENLQSENIGLLHFYGSLIVEMYMEKFEKNGVSFYESLENYLKSSILFFAETDPL